MSTAGADLIVPSPEARVEYILGQLHGGAVPRVTDPRYRFLLPTLTPFQRDFLEWVLDPNAPDRAAVEGGIGCGKTQGIGFAAFIVAMTRPGSYTLLTTATYQDIRDTLYPACVSAFQGAAEYHAGDRKFVFPNGAEVKLLAYQLHSTQDESGNPIEGRNVNALLLSDETQKLPPKLLDHAEERTRGTSTDATGQAYAPKLALVGRPGAIDWWARAVAARGGRVFRPRTAENPANGPRYMAKLREGRTLAEYLSITGDGPYPVKGAAYSCFIANAEGGLAYWPHGNIVRASVCAGPGPVWLSHDPGYGSPALLIIRPVRLLLPPPWAQRQITVHVVLDDLGDGLEQCITSEVIAATRRRLDARGWVPTALIADPAGAARNAQTGQSDLDLWARPRNHTRDHLGPGLGVRIITPTDPGRRDVRLGILRTAALIANAEDPQLRLLCVTDEHWTRCEKAGSEVRNIRNSLLQYTDEIARRKRQTGGDHRSTHHADCLRYYVAEGPGTWQVEAPAPRRGEVKREAWEDALERRWTEDR